MQRPFLRSGVVNRGFHQKKKKKKTELLKIGRADINTNISYLLQQMDCLTDFGRGMTI